MEQPAQSEDSRQGKLTLLAATIGLAFGYSTVGSATFGSFLLPLSERFGWGRGDISVAFTIMSYSVAALTPICGFFADRFGVRPVLIPSIGAFGIAFASLVFTASLSQLYITYFVIAVAAVGTTAPIYARAIVGWFSRNRGLALGIGLSGIGLGTATIPPIVQHLTSSFGWWSGYAGIASIILLITLPSAFFWLREPPRVDHSEQTPKDANPDSVFRAALRTRTFWQLSIAFLCLGVFTAGTLAHLVPLLRDYGLAEETAALAASVLGITIIVARVVTGVLLDRFFAPVVAGLCLIGPVLGSVLLLGSGPPLLAFLAVILTAFGIGAEGDFMSYLISRYHGLRAFTRINGTIYAVFTFGGGLGPLLMGYSQQYIGSYDMGLVYLLGLLLLAVLLLVSLGPYPEEATAKAARSEPVMERAS